LALVSTDFHCRGQEFCPMVLYMVWMRKVCEVPCIIAKQTLRPLQVNLSFLVRRPRPFSVKYYFRTILLFTINF
jgi:hypothetical protein